ncbi:splicing factor 3A subunit 3 [Microthyrium microscopicum]|uniref:Splicing factor 3A subunit 3 n=1 Tax=Microthyrium microscopicum TaxID=703497 RepID=A0A6A6UN58_9PEZI|nr:splicing factor 3A subunit 3 [Microthyrium microscopicum]
MVVEEQRFLHEDIERLEQAIADRLKEEPKQIRERLSRDHQIAKFASRIQDQSKRLLTLYKDNSAREEEVQKLFTGDPLEEFYKQYSEIKDFHKRYPGEPVENLERAYKRRAVGDGEPVAMEVDTMFSGEEGYGRFFDLTQLHEQYLNLPGVNARRITYLQYLDAFDVFGAVKKADKLNDYYFNYLHSLLTYLEDYLGKIRPLEDRDKLFAAFDADFEDAWAKDEVPGWGKDKGANGAAASEESGTFCSACEKSFQNPNVYEHHLSSKKHIRAAEVKKSNGAPKGSSSSISKFKQKVTASREFRIRKLVATMSNERSDTRVNVERKQGMTERERAQELESLLAGDQEALGAAQENESDSDSGEKIYNPLRLPIAWDGKPIPFWLYKLHGLGVEFPCEICGNHVYFGRRAFDKHFNEPKHLHGLRALGISNTTLFREVTSIEDAQKLWKKIQADERKLKQKSSAIVEMEDESGNVMPEKVYNDLRKQGLL